jgi:L-ascorbate peroxidase
MATALQSRCRPANAAAGRRSGGRRPRVTAASAPRPADGQAHASSTDDQSTARRSVLLTGLAGGLARLAAPLTAGYAVGGVAFPPPVFAGTGPLRPLPPAAAAGVRAAFDAEAGKTKAPVLLRLAFHDAAAFDAGRRDGGANGSIRFELDRPESFGLKRGWRVIEAVAKRVAADPATKGEGLGAADLIALGGAYAVAVTGGPAIDVPVGRTDASAADPPGRLPSEDADPAALIASFAAKGLSRTDLVALSGGHTLGAKGFGDPVTFDNAYYSTLLAKPWAHPGAGEMASHIGLPSDRALPEDASLLPLIKKYAADQAAFFRDFRDSYLRMVALGT